MNSKNGKQGEQPDFSLSHNKTETLNVDHIVAIMGEQDIHLDIEKSSNVITGFFNTVDQMLKKGYRVNIPLFNLYKENAQQVPSPSPEIYTDINTSSENNCITPGGVASVKGSHLVFDPKDRAQGIFYIAEDKMEYRVSTIGKVTENELLFFTPDTLPHGRYRIEIRTLPERSLTQVHGALSKQLIV